MKNNELVIEYEATVPRLEELDFCGTSYYSVYYWRKSKESYYCITFKQHLINLTKHERLTDIAIYFL